MTSNEQGQLKYGELVVLGFNGRMPGGDRGRKRSKFALMQRTIANGLRLSVTSFEEADAETWAVSSNYVADENMDMFQIGRSSDSAIDLVVMNECSEHEDQCTNCVNIARFACRILVDRRNPEIVKICAAGFNSRRKMFLGSGAMTWMTEANEVDGLTTNGIYVAQPLDQFVGGGDSGHGRWREVSMSGAIHEARENRVSDPRGRRIETENNILKDGTLISLCGATLLWRSAEGLSVSPNKHDLEELIETLDDFPPAFTSYLRRLLISTRLTTYVAEPKPHFSTRPFAFTECGHVRFFENNIIRMETDNCSVCNVPSETVELCVGLEPAFYVDYGALTHAFHPCGHMATEKTVKYWVDVQAPHGIDGSIAVCPFCATPISGCPGYIKLSFSFV